MSWATKPLSDSETAARQLVETAEAAGVVNMMSLSTRFGGDVQYLGELARQGRSASSTTAARGACGAAASRTGAPHFIQKGGGAFRDMGVHVLDFGMVDPRRTRAGERDRESPERSSARAAWATGIPARQTGVRRPVRRGRLRRRASSASPTAPRSQVESFWASHQPDELQIELFGTDAGARLRPLTLYRLENGAPSDAVVEPPRVPGFAGVASHFIASILDGIPCQAPLRHGLTVQRMLEGLLTSAETGREVRLD